MVLGGAARFPSESSDQAWRTGSLSSIITGQAAESFLHPVEENLRSVKSLVLKMETSLHNASDSPDRGLRSLIQVLRTSISKVQEYYYTSHQYMGEAVYDRNFDASAAISSLLADSSTIVSRVTECIDQLQSLVLKLLKGLCNDAKLGIDKLLRPRGISAEELSPPLTSLKALIDFNKLYFQKNCDNDNDFPYLEDQGKQNGLQALHADLQSDRPLDEQSLTKLSEWIEILPRAYEDHFMKVKNEWQELVPNAFRSFESWLKSLQQVVEEHE